MQFQIENPNKFIKSHPSLSLFANWDQYSLLPLHQAFEAGLGGWPLSLPEVWLRYQHRQLISVSLPWFVCKHSNGTYNLHTSWIHGWCFPICFNAHLSCGSMPTNHLPCLPKSHQNFVLINLQVHVAFLNSSELRKSVPSQENIDKLIPFGQIWEIFDCFLKI